LSCKPVVKQAIESPYLPLHPPLLISFALREKKKRKKKRETIRQSQNLLQQIGGSEKNENIYREKKDLTQFILRKQS
jgi:hypothetical protein